MICATCGQPMNPTSVDEDVVVVDRKTWEQISFALQKYGIVEVTDDDINVRETEVAGVGGE